ncbi:NAD-binding protein [Fomitiporia mediterranea MF3/22]|uniref:NAD-binding protein n=1 Tax=Fomitiporia mediterranea (strain MF3/22) TaxID=694068 RepID=UPI00044082F0|nr:NAD-binding protein [Fomitiporia mediterranea MF3/22]EJD06783.1 NAD-binding protein [Fomitiporia mediterranea MF3/22]
MSKHIRYTHDPALLRTALLRDALTHSILCREALMVSQDSSVQFSTYTPHVAIVTGGAQGIGQAIALRLADDGIDIAVNDIQSKQNQIDNHIRISALVEKTAQELGGVDIMVANAGIAYSLPLLETPTDKLDTIYAVNIRGVFLCLKYSGLQMVKQERGGRLIAASSICGKQGALNLSAYSASKFAIRGIVQSASMELRKYGITVNAYAPGYVNTAMLTSTEADASLKEAAKTVPTAEPESIASIVSHIAKPESYFVNGQSVSVNGGIYFD